MEPAAILSSLAAAESDAQRLVLGRQLGNAVAAQYRLLSPSEFNTASNELAKEVSNMFTSGSSGAKLAGILAVHALADTHMKGNDTTIIRYANLLRNVFERQDGGAKLLRVASKALGHLCKVAGDVSPDFILFEVRRALEWLAAPRGRTAHRLPAVLVCREVADNAPTLFFQFSEPFFGAIPSALGDKDVMVRECAAKALRSALAVVESRRSPERPRWYEELYEQITLLTRSRGSGSAPAVHGGLLALGEVLMRTGQFLRPRFTDTCRTVMGLRSSPDSLIRRAVIALIPQLGAFAPAEFVADYAEAGLEHLLSSLKVTEDRGVAFVALGRFALAIRGHYSEARLKPFLERIVSSVREGLTPKRGRPFCGEGLSCLSMLAEAVGPPLALHMHELLERMFRAGLSVVLVDALRNIVRHIPALLELVQERLLHELSLVLAGRPWAPPPSDAVAMMPSSNANKTLRTAQGKVLGLVHGVEGGAPARGGTQGGLVADADVAGYAPSTASERGAAGLAASLSANAPPTAWTRSMLSGTSSAGGGADREGGATGVSYAGQGTSGDVLSEAGQRVMLALRTLASFDFRGVQLLPFVREVVLEYADDAEPSIRQVALWTAARVLLRRFGDSCHPLGPGPAFEGVVPSPGQLRAQLEAVVPHASAVSMVPAPADMHGGGGPLGGHSGGARRPGSPSRSHRAAGVVPGVDTYMPVLLASTGVTLVVVQEVLFRIVMAAVGDPLPAVRLAAWRCLESRFDPLLAQASTLQCLAVSLHDESFQVREAAVSVLGRALPRNPAFVLPLLRSVLLELLSELEFGIVGRQAQGQGTPGATTAAPAFEGSGGEGAASRTRGQGLSGAGAAGGGQAWAQGGRGGRAGDAMHVTASQEHAALLLGQLITAAQPIVAPYVPPILRALLPKVAVGAQAGAYSSSMVFTMTVRPPPSSILTMNVLGTLGELSKVGAQAMAPYLRDLLALVLGTLQDTSDAHKLQTAVRTLDLLVRNTGAVMLPYIQFPALLPALMEIVRRRTAQPWGLRKEALRAIGTLGALDPHRYHLTQAWVRSGAQSAGGRAARGGGASSENSAEATDEAAVHPLQAAAAGLRPPVVTFAEADEGDALDAGLHVLEDGRATADGGARTPLPTATSEGPSEGATAQGGPLAPPGATGGADDEDPVLRTDIPASRILTTMVADPEDFYPTVALSALLRILQDPSLTTHHSLVLQAVTWVFRALGHRCVPFLPRVVPAFLSILRSKGRQGWRADGGAGGGASLRDSLLQQLGVLVGLVKARMCPYLPAIFELVDVAWPHSLPSILRLVESVANSLPDEFTAHLPMLLRHMLAVLNHPTLPHASAAEVLRGHASAGPEDKERGIEQTRHLLATIAKLGGQLSGHMHMLLPAMCPLLERDDLDPTVQVQAMLTIAHLAAAGVDMRPFVARVLQPLCRVLGGEPRPAMGSVASGSAGEPRRPSSGARKCAADTLCWLACQLGSGFMLFVPGVSRALARSGLHHPLLTKLCDTVVQGGALPPNPAVLMAKGKEEAIEGVAGYLADIAGAELGLVGEIGGGIGAGEAGAGGMGGMPIGGVYGKVEVHAAKLAQAWNTAGCSAKEDWQEWIRRFSVELLRESSSPALRGCSSLAQVHRPLAMELFNAAFVSCWDELQMEYQGPLVEALEKALLSTSLPQDILQTLLNLAEFMEHDGKPLPIDIRTLGALALRCHAYAKALRYREMEFYRQVKDLGKTEWQFRHVSGASLDTSGGTAAPGERTTMALASQSTAKVIETLISINNQLEQPEAAVGILKFARQQAAYAMAAHNPAVDSTTGPGAGGTADGVEHGDAFSVGNLEVKESWYEKLGRWEEALDGYERRWAQVVGDAQGTMGGDVQGVLVSHKLALHVGRMRCLRALGEWDRLDTLVRAVWPQLGDNDAHKASVAPYATRACWALGRWHDMEKFMAYTPDSSKQGSFFRAVLAIHKGHYSTAERFIDRVRYMLSGDLPALVGESYTRAYRHLVTVQQLSEMEEVMQVLTAAGSPAGGLSSWDPTAATGKLTHFRRVWAQRLRGAQRNVDVWHRLLSVRSLVGMAYVGGDDVKSWLKFATLCRRNGRTHMAVKVLMGMGMDGAGGGSAARPGSYFTELEASARGLAAAGGLLPARILAALQGDDVGGVARGGGASTSLLSALGVSAPGAVDAGPSPAAWASSALAPHPAVVYAHCKHLWEGRQLRPAISLLTLLVEKLDAAAAARKAAEAGNAGGGSGGAPSHATYTYGQGGSLTAHEERNLLVKTHLRLGSWQQHMLDTTGQLPTGTRQSPLAPTATAGEAYVHLMSPVLEHFSAATQAGPEAYKAWHEWAMANFQAAQKLAAAEAELGDADGEEARAHLAALRASIDSYAVAAVTGFFASIRLGQRRLKAHVLQDLLRLLTLWFAHGGSGHASVRTAVGAGLNTIPPDTWLHVSPQLIARIHLQDPDIKGLLMSLLAQVGQLHPHAVIYSLTVAQNSSFQPRREAAASLLAELQRHWPTVARQASLVSQELIRVAILWPEQWLTGLNEASHAYFSEKDVDATLAILFPLHDMMNIPAEQMSAFEVEFDAAHGEELAKARDWLGKYQATKDKSCMQAAWDIYYGVFRRIDAEVPQLTSLELPLVSRPLTEEQNMQLAVPGTYRVHKPIVRIACFSPAISIFPSKQRPRRISVAGTDGRWYRFILKGHEDLRQDERVMQLFGLVNTLLSNDPDTRKQDLSIRRYSVTPLSHSAGVVGMLPAHDTWHSLIDEYRQQKKVLADIEQRVMMQLAPMYENLTLLQKLEVFQYALDNTTGQDLQHVLWRKSQSSEAWLVRRTHFTRSLAVMSIVGYVLGLGDRHPSNIMLDRITGKVAHIDFGDCFEVTQTRDKHPERVPFRLTRMLVNAMEVSGIEGNFRCTTEAVQRVMRSNRDSVMAMLEAFVHDPLINWRLLHTNEASGASAGGAAAGGQDVGAAADMAAAGGVDTMSASLATGGGAGRAVGAKGPGGRAVDMAHEGAEGGGTEALNERAVKVLERIKNKLTGRDFVGDPVDSGIGGIVAGQCEFKPLPEPAVQSGRVGRTGTAMTDEVAESLDVPAQVQRLILQATSMENLCQSYMGWCPFW